MKKRYFPSLYRTLEYISASVYVDSDCWEYMTTTQSQNGAYWDIIKNNSTGELRFTNLEDINIFH